MKNPVSRPPLSLSLAYSSSHETLSERGKNTSAEALKDKYVLVTYTAAHQAFNDYKTSFEVYRVLRIPRLTLPPT